MRTTARIELPVGMHLKNANAHIDRERIVAQVAAKITGVTTGERTITVDLELDADIEVSFDLFGVKHNEQNTRGVAVGFKRKDGEA